MSGKSAKMARVDASSPLSSSSMTSSTKRQLQQQQPSDDQQIAKLRADLDTATKCIEQLRREKDYELRLAREDEQNRSSLALKELETRLRAEWRREVDRTRETVRARLEADTSRLVGRYERTVKRLSGDLDRCRNELRDEIEKRGTSSASRAAADTDRVRLLAELNELRAAKRRLEESLESANELDKRNKAELKRAYETSKNELAKVSKEANAEIKKLLDELKAKDHQLALLDRNQYPDRGVSLPKQTVNVEISTSKPAASSPDTTDKATETINSLKKELRKMKDELALCESDKSAMRTRIDELRRELTQRNETIVNLQNLQHNVTADSTSAKNPPKVVRFLLPGSTLPVMAREIEVTTPVCDIDDDTLSDISCDTLSSTSSVMSPDLTPALYDDNIEKNYQLLLTEHLNLQKSIAVLLASLSKSKQQSVAETADDEDCNRQKCTVEKDSLRAAFETMKEKKCECDENVRQLQFQLQEQKELNEDLEFRVFELEEVAEKCKMTHSDSSADALLDKLRHLESELAAITDQLATYRTLESEIGVSGSLREFIDDLKKRLVEVEHDAMTSRLETADLRRHVDAVTRTGLTRLDEEDEDLSLCGATSAMTNSMSTTTSGFDDDDVSCASSVVEELPFEGEVAEEIVGRFDVTEDETVNGVEQVQQQTSESVDDEDATSTSSVSELAMRVEQLESKLARAMQSERRSRDQAALLAEEKDRRIAALQQQVDQLESNEFRLAETIRALEHMEQSFIADVNNCPDSIGKQDDNTAGQILEISLSRLRSIKSECTEVDGRIKQLETTPSIDDDLETTNAVNDTFNFEAEYRELESLLRELKRVLVDETPRYDGPDMTSSFVSSTSGCSSYSLPCSPVIDVMFNNDDDQTRELELVEQNWKQQVSMLEDERDILRDAVRETEGVVRELSVRLVELESNERSSADEINRLRAKVDWLIGRNDDLLELVARLEDSVRNHRSTESELRSRCDRHETRSTELSAELDEVRDELAAAERRYRRWVRQLEEDKSDLERAVEQLTDRNAELESREAGLVCRTRRLETVEVGLRGELATIERTLADMSDERDRLLRQKTDDDYVLLDVVPSRRSSSAAVSCVDVSTQCDDGDNDRQRLSAAYERAEFFKEMLEMTEQSYSAVEASLEDRNRQMTELAAVIEDQSADNDRLTAELKELQDGYNQLQQKYDSLSSINEKLNNHHQCSANTMTSSEQFEAAMWATVEKATSTSDDVTESQLTSPIWSDIECSMGLDQMDQTPQQLPPPPLPTSPVPSTSTETRVTALPPVRDESPQDDVDNSTATHQQQNPHAFVSRDNATRRFSESRDFWTKRSLSAPGHQVPSPEWNPQHHNARPSLIPRITTTSSSSSTDHSSRTPTVAADMPIIRSTPSPSRLSDEPTTSTKPRNASSSRSLIPRLVDDGRLANGSEVDIDSSQSQEIKAKKSRQSHTSKIYTTVLSPDRSITSRFSFPGSSSSPTNLHVIRLNNSPSPSPASEADSKQRSASTPSAVCQTPNPASSTTGQPPEVMSLPVSRA